MHEGKNVIRNLAGLERRAAMACAGDKGIVDRSTRIGGNPRLAQAFGLQVGHHRIGVAMPDQYRRQGFADLVQPPDRPHRTRGVAVRADGKAKKPAFRAVGGIGRAHHGRPAKRCQILIHGREIHWPEQADHPARRQADLQKADRGRHRQKRPCRLAEKNDPARINPKCRPVALQMHDRAKDIIALCGPGIGA